MLAAEGDLAQLLDADEPTLSALLAAVREPWLARGLVALSVRSPSHPRALDLLLRAPEHHARHALDALAELLRAGSQTERRHAARALAALIARAPPWLPALAAHDVTRQLLRLLRPARDPCAALHAILALATLLPTAPNASPALWPELGDAFVRLAAGPTHPHLAVGTLALFRALYEVHPCALLDRLRAECTHNQALRQAMPPLLESVRLHPRLVLGADAEPPPPAAPSSGPRRPPASRPSPASPRAPPRAPPASPAPPAPGDPLWFCLSERCGAESAPHTPQPAAEGSPPEAAVEATPENTPVKEARAAFQFPGGRVSPAGVGGRLARVVMERARAVGSPVPLTATPPPGVVRVRAVRRPPPGRSRARSCPPGGRREAGCQTEAPWGVTPADVAPADLSLTAVPGSAEPDIVSPSERLDDYLHNLYNGLRAPNTAHPAHDLADQLELTHALLQYERWRRDAHAERNRRLLGKCRAARALEQDNAALRDRARALQADLDALRARPPPRPTPAPAPPPDPRQDQVDARLRAEAAALAAQQERDRALDSLGAATARLDELERRLHADGRWARVAAARADAADALKRELVMRGEREARLEAAAMRGLARAGDAEEARRAAVRAGADAAAALSAAAASEARAAAAEARAVELEASLASREAALAAARRDARGAAEASAARLGAVQDKYRAVLHALRRVHLRRLESLAGGGTAGRAGCSESSPLSASLAEGGAEGGRSPPLSDLSRHLLDDDDAPP